MDLEEFALENKEVGYTDRAKRRHAIHFFSYLPKDIELSQESWKDLINIGEAIYFTTFTDDSDYIPGTMNLSALNKQPLEIKLVLLDYIYRGGNYIVKMHVDDYRKQKI